MAEMEPQSWALAGRGLVGAELLSQVIFSEGVADRLGLNPEPEWVATTSGLMLPPEDPRDLRNPESYRDLGARSWESLDEAPDVVFIALPSGESTGDQAFRLIKHVASEGGVAVTAEKRSQATKYDEISAVTEGQTRFGKNASFGGGTRSYEVARQYLYDLDNVTQIHIVANGTMNAIMHDISGGMSSGQAVDSAILHGYAEPGAETSDQVFRDESESDLAMKIHNFMRTQGMAEDFDWQRLKMSLSDEDLKRIKEESGKRRLIASIYPAQGGVMPESDILPAVDDENHGVIIDGTEGRAWRVVIGYRDVSKNEMLRPFSEMPGASNGMIIGLGKDEKDGIYKVAGPGAGAAPTVNAMLDDHLRIATRLEHDRAIAENARNGLIQESEAYQAAKNELIAKLEIGGGYESAISFLGAVSTMRADEMPTTS